MIRLNMPVGLLWLRINFSLRTSWRLLIFGQPL